MFLNNSYHTVAPGTAYYKGPTTSVSLTGVVVVQDAVLGHMRTSYIDEPHVTDALPQRA